MKTSNSSNSINHLIYLISSYLLLFLAHAIHCDRHSPMAASLSVSLLALFCFIIHVYVHIHGARVGPVSGAVGGGLSVRLGVCVCV